MPGTTYNDLYAYPAAAVLTIGPATTALVPTRGIHILNNTGPGTADILDISDLIQGALHEGATVTFRLQAGSAPVMFRAGGNISLPGNKPVLMSVSGTEQITFRGNGNGVSMAEIVLPGVTNPKTLFVSAQPSTTVSNIAVETAFDVQFTIAANLLALGSKIRIHALVQRLSQNAADTDVIRIRVGGVAGAVIAQSAAVATGQDSRVWIDASFTVRAIGAGGTMVFDGEAKNAGAGNPVAPVATSLTGSFGNPSTTALNTTIAQTLVVTVVQSAQNPANQTRLERLEITQE